ncbi:MAG: hypothetical protein KGD65_10120 [Candidatus Lokiarchaeota archaeon]|nr:hypothetical protein [Candidatus Lokiarchaeota archaeon]
MKKLAKKLGKVDIKLSKWTRDLLYTHLIEVCEGLEEHDKLMKLFPSKQQQKNT